MSVADAIISNSKSLLLWTVKKAGYSMTVEFGGLIELDIISLGEFDFQIFQDDAEQERSKHERIIL